MKKTGKTIGFLRGILDTLDLKDEHAVRSFLASMLDASDELSDRLDEAERNVSDLQGFTQELDDALTDLEQDFDSGLSLGNLLFGDNENGSVSVPSLQVIPGTESADRRRFLQPALCPKCSGVFLCDPGAFSTEEATQFCPHCGKSVAPLAITPDNTPVAKPLNDE